MKKAIIGLFIFGLAAVALCATYDGIYVQGKIFNGRDPVNGTADINVQIVNSGFAGSVWSKTYSGTTVNNGVFSLYLSDTTGAFNTIDWSRESDIIFTVNGDTLPNQKLVSVPYTFMAKRIYGGTVEATALTAKRSGAGVLPEARMAYQSTITDEAVAAWIGKDAVGKLGIEDKKSMMTNYYGAFAEGRDYGIYAESAGQAVYAASIASAESLGAALQVSGVITSLAGVGTRIIGPIKVARPFYMSSILPGGMTSTPSETRPGAADAITISSGSASYTVRNSLIKAGTTLIFFQVISSGRNPRVWITDLVDGRFTLRRSDATLDMKIGYLLVN